MDLFPIREGKPDAFYPSFPSQLFIYKILYFFFIQSRILSVFVNILKINFGIALLFLLDFISDFRIH